MILADQDYTIEFSLLMPEAHKTTSYPITVNASCMEEALTKAKAKWDDVVSQYSVKINATKKKTVGDS